MYYVQYTTYCIEFMRNKLLVFLYSGEEDREGGKGRRKRKEERIGGKERRMGRMQHKVSDIGEGVLTLCFKGE